MPELPEVETTVRGLQKLLVGQRLAAVQVRVPKLRFPLPKSLARNLTGATIESVTRRAKYILIGLDNGKTLLVHLGMSGRMHQIAPMQAPAKHDHLVLRLANDVRITFNDPRRFGLLDLCSTGTLPQHKLLAPLGPEPFSRALTVAYLASSLRGRKTSIKQVLLDQRVVAGLGNIYVSEALFWSGIHPARAAGSLKAAELQKLVPAIQKVLKASIKAGGTSMRDYVQADGAMGFFQDQFAVYDRAGLPCPGCNCKKSVQHVVQGGRSTYFCPKKQR